MPTTAALPTFRDWLAERRRRDTAIGDLARDALCDPAWLGDCPTTLRHAVARHPACPSARRALVAAERRWRRQRARAIDTLLAQLDDEGVAGSTG